MKNEGFIKLSKEIDFKITNSFEHVKITKAKLEDGYFDLNFEMESIIPFDEMRIFLDKLAKNFKYKVKFQFKPYAIVYDEEQIRLYGKDIIENFLNKKNIIPQKEEIDLHASDNLITVKLHNPILKKQFDLMLDDIIKVLKMFGFLNIKGKTILMNHDSMIIENEKSKLKEAISQFKNNKKEEYVPEKSTPKNYNNSSYTGYTELKLEELSTSNINRVIVKGEIFKVETKKTKTDKWITTFSITDYKEAVYVKTFSANDAKLKELDKFTIGKVIEVRGQYQIDAFTNAPTIISSAVRESELNEEKREDNEPQKRVELAARTRMSTMDGIVTPTELIKRAEKWGHNSIAIVDQDSVQSFPEFFNASSNSSIKPIYGVSMNTIDKSNDIIFWPNNKEILLKGKYVVFDLETTGLSPELEEIIEFGAVKVENGEIVNKEHFFIKPTRKLSNFTTEFTGITDDMLKNAISEKEAVLKIKKYVEDYALVAHNANFDITFVNAKLAKHGEKIIQNPTIDTMVVARILLPKAKSYRLERVSYKFEVNYDVTVAHRADYDADVLAKVWIKMMNKLKDEVNIVTQKDLHQYHDDNLHHKKFTKEVTLLAKNQNGLKELFEFISLSLTDNFFGRPSLFFENLNNRKNLLLGSGSLNSRLVDRILYGSKEQIKNEISFYDYIEIQPLENYAHIINRGVDKESLEDILKFVITESKKQGKIVVATGDVRYLDDKDKIYHEIYINAKGLGGVRHSLFKYDEENPIYPTQKLLTTNEMKTAFNFLGDVKLINEIVVENTNKIANMIDKIEVIKKDLYTPKFKDADEKLTEKVYQNARAMYGDKLPSIIEKRIEKELIPIKKYGFAVIYWISHLLVDKSLKDGYLVGSRGSVGSSFVATMSKITEVNPLQPHYICNKCKQSEWPQEYIGLNSGYDLPDKDCDKCKVPYSKEGQNIPFETFLGFEANKVPDIDLNFSGDYQPIIHNEVKKLFGEKHSFRAGTISTVAEKTAFGYVKAFDEENKKNMSKAFIEFIAKGVAGTKRTTGQHPGGIIVIPKEFSVEDFTPINYPANDVNSSWKTTHFDFHAIHDNVLKLDLLGHDDPTAIKYLEELTGVDAKKDIPFSDKKIISLFSSTEALGIKPEDIDGEITGAMGIPEFGTNFVRGMLKNAKVSSFGDLIAVSGLSHGTDVWTNNAEPLVKQGVLTLDEVISCRDNIMTDLMNKGLEPLLAFEIMERVRKGKSITPDQEKELKKFKIDDWYIDSLKKIKYMFPKAHATAYVMMAWRIAWFKLYKPLAYYTTYFTARSDVFDIETIIKGKEEIMNKLKDFKSRKFKYGSDKLSNKEVALIPIFEIALEALARGIKFENISLIKSHADKWIMNEETNTIIPPFTALDGLGINVANSIVEARDEKEFISIEDFKTRTAINSTSLEKLRELDVLDGLSETNQISLF